MNILITGGAGFIGSNIADAYIEAGHNVVVVDDLSTGVESNVNARAKFHKMDIRNRSVEEIFRRHSIDVLNHHAAQMDVRRSVEDPEFDASVNIAGSLNLFECARRAGVKKVLFASTGGAIYGEQIRFPADEEHPTNPLSPYGISKLAVEKYLSFYRNVHGITTIVLRYANVYGPRQRPDGEAGVVAIFAEKMMNGETPVINGDGSQTRDFTFVGDVVRANLLGLGHRESETFNVGTGVESDVNEIFRHLKHNLGSAVAERHGPPKAGEQKRSVISAEKIGRILNWRPSVALDEGLKRTSDWFQKNKIVR